MLKALIRKAWQLDEALRTALCTGALLTEALHEAFFISPPQPSQRHLQILIITITAM